MIASPRELSRDRQRTTQTLLQLALSLNTAPKTSKPRFPDFFSLWAGKRDLEFAPLPPPPLRRLDQMASFVCFRPSATSYNGKRLKTPLIGLAAILGPVSVAIEVTPV